MKLIEEGAHPVIVIIDDDGTRYVGCGQTWDTGGCGHAALVVMVEGQEHRVYGSMVAHGPVVQPFRVVWAGTKVLLPEAVQDWIRNRQWA